MKRFLSLILSFVFVFGSVFMSSQTVFADGIGAAYQTEERTADASLYPEKYDPRETGQVSPIKDQYTSNNCWAYGTAAAIDQALIKQGLVTDPSKLNVSGKSLAYSLFNREDDPLHNTTGDKNIPTVSYDKSGLHTRLAAFFLSTWLGISVFDPDTQPDWSLSSSSLEATLDYSLAAYRMKNCYFYYLPTVEEVKSAIMKYGALEVTIDTGQLYGDTVYYNPSAGESHSVCVVGWDDSISSSKFGSGVTQDGAWIIKNSWGSYIHENGYLYITYDYQLTSGKAYEIMTADEYDNNYFYDGTASDGTTDRLFFSGTTNHEAVANVFEAQKESDTEAEYLKAVNVAFTCSKGSKVNCDVKIYTDVNLDSSNPENGKLVHTQTASFEQSGVYTIDLDKAIELKKGQKFSVVMELDAGENGTVSTYLARSGSLSTDGNAVEITNPNQSFLLRGSDEWQDLYGIVNNFVGERVARIKAFTVTEDKEIEKTYTVDALGGSIRVNETPGLRFGFSYDKTQLNGTENIEEYGFLYSYSQTDDLAFGAAGVRQTVANNRIDHGDYITYNLVFTSMPKSAFEQVLSARAYIKIDGEYYYSDVVQRSFKGVADSVLADSEIDQTTKDKVSNILNS